MLKVQRIKTIRGIREIRSQRLNLFYIMVKGMVGKKGLKRVILAPL